MKINEKNIRTLFAKGALRDALMKGHLHMLGDASVTDVKADWLELYHSGSKNVTVKETPQMADYFRNLENKR